MVVVTNRIPVAKGHEIDLEDRFKRRVHLVDRSPGFVRNEVHRPRPMTFDHERGAWTDDPAGQGYYEVKTWWRTFEDFVAWTKSSRIRRGAFQPSAEGDVRRPERARGARDPHQHGPGPGRSMTALAPSGLQIVPDMPICQQDLPLDWYQPEFQPYAEEYLALPDRFPENVLPWMDGYIRPALATLGDNVVLLAHYYPAATVAVSVNAIWGGGAGATSTSHVNGGRAAGHLVEDVGPHVAVPIHLADRPDLGQDRIPDRFFLPPLCQDLGEPLVFIAELLDPRLETAELRPGPEVGPAEEARHGHPSDDRGGLERVLDHGAQALEPVEPRR